MYNVANKPVSVSVSVSKRLELSSLKLDRPIAHGMTSACTVSDVKRSKAKLSFLVCIGSVALSRPRSKVLQRRLTDAVLVGLVIIVTSSCHWLLASAPGVGAACRFDCQWFYNYCTSVLEIALSRVSTVSELYFLWSIGRSLLEGSIWQWVWHN